VAAMAVGVICVARLVIARSRRGWRSNAIALTALMLAVAAAALYLQSRYITDTASRAMDIRWEFLKTTWRMIEAHPWFGVGIGQYHQSSAQYSSAALLAIYPRENAHNYFAQVAGELGLIGLAAFVTVLAICFLPSNRLRHDPLVASVIAALAAFIVSWLAGHPLLVPEVAYPFWLALAIVAGSAGRKYAGSAEQDPACVHTP
jgi:O-antigen ligase